MFPMAKTITPKINVEVIKKCPKCPKNGKCQHNGHKHSFNILNELLDPFEQPSSNLLPQDNTPQDQQQVSPEQPYSDTQQPAVVLPTLSSLSKF